MQGENDRELNVAQGPRNVPLGPSDFTARRHVSTYRFGERHHLTTVSRASKQIGCFVRVSCGPAGARAPDLERRAPASKCSPNSHQPVQLSCLRGQVQSGVLQRGMHSPVHQVVYWGSLCCSSARSRRAGRLEELNIESTVSLSTLIVELFSSFFAGTHRTVSSLEHTVHGPFGMRRVNAQRQGAPGIASQALERIQTALAAPSLPVRWLDTVEAGVSQVEATLRGWNAQSTNTGSRSRWCLANHGCGAGTQNARAPSLLLQLWHGDWWGCSTLVKLDDLSALELPADSFCTLICPLAPSALEKNGRCRIRSAACCCLSE